MAQPLVNPSAAPQAARYQPLVAVTAAVAAGMVLDRYRPLPLGVAWWTAVGAWLAWWAAWRMARDRAATVCLLACLFFTGAAWHHACWYLFAADDLGAFAAGSPGPVCLEAVALSGPRRMPAPAFDPLRPIATGDRTRLALRVLAVRDADWWRRAGGRVELLVEGHVLGVRAGDRVRVFAQLAVPRRPLNPGEFDFAGHCRGDRRLSTLAAEHPDCVSRVAVGPGWSPSRWLDRLRLTGSELLWRNVDSQRSGLALALLLGERNQLDAEQTRRFFETGTVHLLSISGLHVGILASFLFAALRLGLCPRTWALVAVAAITVAYALVIDAEPPAVRATILVLLTCAALYAGRPVAPLNLLAASALVVVAMNPADLFRIGPQLSFLAVGTLACAGPRLRRGAALDPLERLIRATRPLPLRLARAAWDDGRRMLWLSLAVWLVPLPLVLAQFHLLSPAALVLTPLLTIPVAVGLLAGFLLLVVGWLMPPLAPPLGAVCNAALDVVVYGVQGVGSLPGSHFWLPGPPTWWLIGFYAAAISFAIAPGWLPHWRWRVALAAAWVAVGLFAATQRSPAGRLQCTALAVGHGCSVVIELPDGRSLLYDAGQFGSPEAAARSISGFLWSRGRTHLDAVVISHADIDHYNALPTLLARFSVGAVYVSPVMFEAPSRATDALRKSIAAAGVPLREIWAGDLLSAGADCRVEVLHPPRRGTLGTDNSNSIVLAVESAGRRLLLTGDLESPGLDELLAESPLDCDVILAPHHGSARSDPPGFAAWSTPEWVIVSGGPRSDRPEVTAAYRAQGARVLNTSREGAVSVTFATSGISVVPCLARPSVPAAVSPAEVNSDDEERL